jgi:glycosyltransferase involved in cell wall biosynthesis
VGALRIFLIPSWFPSKTNPVAGIFIEDQVRALARRRPGWQIAVSGWGQEETVIELRHPFTSIPRVLDRQRRRPSERRLAPNAVVYSNPVVHWTPRLLAGRFDALVRANVANAARARRDLGGLDVIHAHAAFPAGLIALQLARELGIPYVVTAHAGQALQARVDRTELGRSALTEGLRNAAAIIAVSRALGTRLAEAGAPPTDVIPNVVDEEFFTPATSPPAAERPRVFTLGRLVEGKGIVELLEATARIRSGGFPVELRIGGDGPRRAEWERHARSLGLGDDVAFLGHLTREAVRDELRECSCFALASESETFGVVCIEALACGRPVVATRSGGPEEIVTDDNGMLVPPRDVEALAEGLRAVLGRAYDSDAIRRDAVRRFGTEKIAAALEAVYRRVTAG